MKSSSGGAADQQDFWSVPIESLFVKLGSSPQGLTSIDARRILASHPVQLQKTPRWQEILGLLVSQFQSPIILILLGAATVSFFLGAVTDACIILVIVGISGLLGFWQEWGAADAVKNLLAMVQTCVSVLRDGQTVEVRLDEVVPGDIAVLRAGDFIPGDGRLLEAKDLFVTEATLTGETFPVEKTLSPTLPANTLLSERSNCLFLGSSVVSGKARLIVTGTGQETEFGQISASLRLRPPETGFERGIRHFGYLLMQVTLLLVLAIFAINVYLNHFYFL